MNRIILLVVICFLGVSVFTQEKDDKEKVKTGWTFGVLPAVSYDSDLGFKYGGIVNFFNFGDGTSYPDYMHNVYFEVNKTTKGSGTIQFFFDSPEFSEKFPYRTTIDVSYLTEQALDFYGFNGYEAAYFPEFEDDSNPFYKSRMYYRMDRKLFRFTADFQGQLKGENLRWLLGGGYFNYQIGSVDIDKLNKGKEGDDLLPDTSTLYDEYIDYGLLSSEEANGGSIPYLRSGLVFDSRDNEANAMKGIWSEALLTTSPRFLGNSEHPHTKLTLVHRQYFTIVKKRLSLAYRLYYQGSISGKAPFYHLSYLYNSYSPSTISEGVGGAKSVRGVLRDRVIGDDIAFGNVELRWKFLRTVVFNQNLYLALSTFMDGGQVIDPYEVNKQNINAAKYNLYFDVADDNLHLTYGFGFRAALNETFIVALDYGRPLDERDGNGGVYVGLNWLF
jgi:hypothetical protein